MAERAGVSVGTMYQYFPHKQALFRALNGRFLDGLAQRVESACAAQHGAPVGRMIDVLIATYWRAKMERPDVTRALYQSVAEIDNQGLIDPFASRVDAAQRNALQRIGGALRGYRKGEPALVTTIFGAVRNIFERNLPVEDARVVRDQLTLMCNAYGYGPGDD